MFRALEIKVDRFLDAIIPSQRGGKVGYAIALGLVLAALWGRFAIAPTEAGLPFLTFFPAVTLAAVLGGIGPGLFAMVACAMLASYLFIPPFRSFPFTFDIYVVWSNAVFCMEEMIVIITVETMYRQRSNYITTTQLLDKIKEAEQELKISAAAFEVQEGVIICDANTVILRVNQAFIEVTGYASDEIVGQTPRLLKSGRHDAAFYVEIWESINRTGSWQGEIWDRHKNGEIRPKWMTITSIKAADGKVTHYVATQTDITASKTAENEIRHLAFFDPLTQLPNRRLLLDRLHQALAASVRSKDQGALLFIDLDNFKTLNDTEGHDVGDLLLKQVAERIVSCVREGDTVARLGGDEFVVMLTGLKGGVEAAVVQAKTVGKKIIDALNQLYNLAGHEHYCSASIGVTLFNEYSGSSDDLLKQADIAMYQAKMAGRNALRFFDPQMQSSLSARAALEKDLRHALPKNQFRLYYQTQAHHDGRIVGAEVLLRWHHPEHGLILPLAFIPLAEETGLIQSIGQWVLESTCTQLRSWQENPNTRRLQLAVNISARQFHRSNFVDIVLQAMEDHGFDGDRLKLEIELTESVVLANIDDAVAKMNILKEAGVRLSMDDFGTGYSSLAYLTRLPFDQLKIDQSFIRNIGVKSADETIVQTIIGMANTLGMEVIAEGVETEAQRAFLEQHGCPVYQGYLLGRPVPLAEFEKKLIGAAVWP